LNVQQVGKATSIWYVYLRTYLGRYGYC
jgi:hypothetical protein